jgi:hypothetical protein
VANRRNIKLTNPAKANAGIAGSGIVVITRAGLGSSSSPSKSSMRMPTYGATPGPMGKSMTVKLRVMQ